jgi:glucose dehydrogenase
MGRTQIKLGRRSFLAGVGGLIGALSIPDFNANGQSDQSSAPSLPTGHFGDIDENTVFDVCIIGSGFAGAVLGEALVRHGIKTVILESGSDPRAKSIDPRIQQLDVYRSSGPINYPVVATRFRGLGGTSWLWGGMCPRLHPLDFQKHSYTSGGASWPITYKDLEIYYEKAEQALRVRGGPRSKYDSPQQRDYPLKPRRSLSPLESIMRQAGIVISDVPRSTSKYRNPSIFSDRFGPFVLMTDNHLPVFQKSSFGTLISEVTVTRLLADNAGHITGAEIKDLDRNTKVLRARVYIVACGALETPRLLLLSRSPAFPHGIGNNHDLVGRFFMEHRGGLECKGPLRIGWENSSFYELVGKSYQYYQEFKNLGLGGMVVGCSLDGAIDGSEIRAWQIGKALNRLITRNLTIGISTEMKPSPENRVSLDTKAKDYFGNPGTCLYLSDTEEDLMTLEHGKKILLKICTKLGISTTQEESPTQWGHHHMGTCRMGDNSRTSVVDRNLRVHQTTNLFIAGSSVFVTSGVANPTLSLTALTLRLSDYLHSQLQKGAFATPRGIRLNKALASVFNG